MRSSTSSSERGRRKYRRAAALFAAVLAAVLALSLLAWREVIGSSNIAAVQVPPPRDNDYYLAFFRDKPLDHHVLYWDLNETASRAMRHADVVFVGSSRMMFACRRDVFDPFFEKHGLSYYVLGFGCAEADLFAFEMLKTHTNVKLVIVNSDSFFRRGITAYAFNCIKAGIWDARKTVWESTMGFYAQRYLHAVVPRWADWRNIAYGRQELVIYRSSSTGCWDTEFRTAPPAVPFTPAPPAEAVVADRTLADARAFTESVRLLGSRVVLTSVPAPNNDTTEAAQIAAALKTPYLTLPTAGLSLCDRSHLDEASARIVAAALLKELEKTPEFQALAAYRAQHR